MREGWQQDGRYAVFLDFFRLNSDDSTGFFVLQDELLYYVMELLGKLSIKPAFNLTHNYIIKHN